MSKNTLDNKDRSASKTNEIVNKPSKQIKKNSVAMRLNIVNILIILSGFLSVIGAYEIQKGGKMHELNYLHQKYITQLVKSVKTFEVNTNTNSLDLVEQDILLIRQQPIDCLDLVGPIDLFMMKMINTDYALQVCEDDLLIADKLIRKIERYKMDEVDKPSLVTHLHEGIDGFNQSGVMFGPLVVKTVKATFFIVITIILTMAFIVPIFGLLLARSVSRDYKTLSTTKIHLEKEKKYNVLIQSERLASLNTLVAGIAHEVNTPLGVSITANSHTFEILKKLKDAYQSKKLKESDFCEFFLEMEEISNIINGNLVRTASLIDSFKLVSVDQSVEELQKIEFKSYIEQVLLTLSPLTKQSDLTVKLTCDEGLFVMIYGGALIQVITNVVTNTINHAFKDSKKGTLLISVIKTNESEMLLSFEDDGCGISEVNLIHIFEPFFTTGRGNGSTGLGLHILHNLVVDKLKGRVSCSSEVGCGTRFDIYLPIAFIA